MSLWKRCFDDSFFILLSQARDIIQDVLIQTEKPDQTSFIPFNASRGRVYQEGVQKS